MGQARNRASQIASLLLSAACLSVGANAIAYDIRDIAVGTTIKAVKLEYGAPDKKEFVANYEIWNYVSSDSQNCQLFFEKNVLTQPVKCAAIEPATKRGFASAK